MMKRILLGALAALVSLTAIESAQAGRTFGLFVGGPWCCHSCGYGSICVRPYNAFSPVCCGCIPCDGMMPFGCGMPGLCYGGMGYGPVGPGCGPFGYDAGPPCDSLPTGGYPMIGPEVPMAPGAVSVQQFPGAAQANYPGNNVQPVSYIPPYGYGYAPARLTYPMMNYAYPMGQVPSYWNPMGGR